jgi:hypothetical protein
VTGGFKAQTALRLVISNTLFLFLIPFELIDISI